ncbi:MAG: RuBisCO large subunit C-terminal-like domain-containing protein [Candidatus Heimdallarchaeota archaeon]
MTRDLFKQYDHIEEALQEGIDPEEYIIGTYMVQLGPRMDPWYLGRAAAMEQSTGTWVPVPANTPELRAKYGAKVVGVYEVPSYEFEIPKKVERRNYIYQIAFPMINQTDQIGLMLTATIGNISMGGRLKLLDLRFPKKWIKLFKGPKFGIGGLRKLLKVPTRPLLNNMIKPCSGWTPEVGADLFYNAALGGCDVVKDDELIADMDYNRLADRVPLFMEKVDQVREETGEETLYTANITDKLTKLKENALVVQEAGGNALMVNYLVIGFPALRMLAEDPEIKLPILGHMDFAGAFYESPYSGVSSFLIMGKLARLAGADIVVYPAPYGKAPFLKEKYVGIARALRYRMHGLKPTLPMPSGGITPGMVLRVMKDLGFDVMIGSGGGIHAHPNGPVAGARAFRQAIDIGMAELDTAMEDFEDYVEEHEEEYPELSVAMETWGVSDTRL